MVLFVCSSSYQLLNAMQISRMLSEKADLVFTTKHLKVDVSKLKEKGYFNDVFFWYELSDEFDSRKDKTRAQRFRRNVMKIPKYVRLKRIYQSLPNREKTYTTIYISYMDFSSQCIYYYFRKTGAVLSLYDDGIYSYHCLSCRPSLFRRLACYGLFKSYSFDEVVSFYSRDSKSIDIGNHCDIVMNDIPPVPDSLSKEIVSIFGGGKRDIDAFSRKVIFFDQCFGDESSQLLQQQIANALFAHFGDDLIIKLHPTTAGSTYDERIAQLRSSVPYEVISGLISQNDKVLISVFSTACFTPSIIKKEEPTVVLAFNMLDEGNPLSTRYIDVFENLKEGYSDKNKVSAPGNLEELLSIVGKRIRD